MGRFLGLKSIVAVGLFLSLIVSSALRAENVSIESVSNGIPPISEGPLAESSFVPVETKRLANSRLLWVNWDLLRDMGIERPAEGLTPEFEKKILDQFAYSIPRASDRPDLFIQNQEKTFYADRYGGNGMGAAGGSGRAAAAGKFQLKGIGMTPLVDLSKTQPEPGESLYQKISRIVSDYTHSHGGVNVSEAVREAQWAEVLHRELPYGANRIAFIISTGTTTPYWGVASEPRALIVRENSVRPGHFMANWGRMEKKDTKGDEKERIRALIPHITDSLPAPTDKRLKKGSPSYLAAQITESADRIARKFAAEYARSYYHGATSNSNVQIDGKAIDFGPMTAVHGFPLAQFADDYPAGSPDSLNDAVIKGFIQDVRKYAPEDWKEKLPTYTDLKKVTRDAYRDQLDRDFLWLAGTPPELLDEVKASPAGLKLSRLLQEVARAGNDEVRDTRYGIAKHTGLYDLPAVLHALNRFRSVNDFSIAFDFLARAVPDKDLRTKLKAAFDDYLLEVEPLAQSKRVTPERLQKYMEHAIERRNRPMDHLYRNPTKEVLGRLVGWQGGWGDLQAAVSAVMNDAINESGKADRCGGMCNDLEIRSNPETGMTFRRYYDARDGKTKFAVELAAHGEGVNYAGREISPSDAELIQLRFEGRLNSAALATRKLEGGGIRLIFEDGDMSKLQSTWLRGREHPLTFPGTGRAVIAPSRKCPWSSIKRPV